MANQPQAIPSAWAANNSTTNSIPATTTESGKASWDQGFPVETSLPLSAGGIPPKYGDFNGVLKALSQFCLFAQEGGQFAYDATVDYTAGALVQGSDNALYECLIANGPGSTVVNPVGDTSGKWGKLATASDLAGYALDSAVVKLAGAQEITGAKTFSAGMIAATGNILQRSGDAAWLRINGGTSNTNGASLTLFGKDETTQPGKFFLQAHDGTNAKALVGFPSGNLQWDSKDIITNGGDQTIGGTKTFSNTIKSNNNTTVVRNVTDQEIQLCGGTSITTGGSFLAWGKDKNQASFAGAFMCRATLDGATRHDLMGRPDGTLTWDGKDFVYTSGDQTITGAKTIQSTIIVDGTLIETGMRQGTSARGLSFYGGTNSRDGAILVLYGGTRDELTGQFRLRASTTSAFKDMIGTPTGGLTWGGQNIQVGSDRRIKTAIGHFPDAVLEAWDKISWEQFKYIEDVERKGEENCRFHAGLIAQDVQQACEEQGQDILQYGILCHEEWQNEYETKEDGTKELVHPAGELWTVRYTEALCLEAAYQRRRADRAEARITALEQRLGELEDVLASLIAPISEEQTAEPQEGE